MKSEKQSVVRRARAGKNHQASSDMTRGTEGEGNESIVTGGEITRWPRKPSGELWTGIARSLSARCEGGMGTPVK